MVEFLKSEIVIDLLPKFAKTVPELMISDIVPDSLMPDIGPRCLAYYYYYYYCYYYSALCRKALLAIVYCTRSNKFFLLY